MEGDAQIGRIAAIWCREMGDTIPSSRQYLMRWVKRDYGPVLDKDMLEPISVKLLDEIKHQIRVRDRRKHAKEILDPLTDRDLTNRIARLLHSALGPARSWVAHRRLTTSDDGEYRYVTGKVVHSGLIAGVVPVQMRIAGIRNPNLLVYRETGRAPKSYWIPGSVWDIDDAFMWVVPKAVKDLVCEFDGPNLQVELDYERQACRIVTPYGRKLIAWRGLQAECE